MKNLLFRCATLALILVAMNQSARLWAQDKQAPASGIELSGRSKDEPGLEYWNVYDAKTNKQVAHVYNRWGFTPLPPDRIAWDWFRLAVTPWKSPGARLWWRRAKSLG